MLTTPTTPVMSKGSKRNGFVSPPKETGYHVRIAGKGANAQIDVLKMNDTTKQIEFCKSFKVGDVAEHDSYNFSYLGDIVAITEKTVTITDTRGGSKTNIHRLDLYTFCWRNHNLDLVETTKRNMEVSYNI